ncbi:hypothetical protein JZ751_015816, partial [Albula glossodonta]
KEVCEVLTSALPTLLFLFTLISHSLSLCHPLRVVSMSELYTNVVFRTKSNYGVESVSQDDDVTYAEVRTRDDDFPQTWNRNQPAVSDSTENTGPSSHPYRLAAVCLGLLCVLLLTAIIALCVHYTGDQSCSEIRRNYSSLTEENAKLQRNYSSLTEENAKLQRNYSILTEENSKQCTRLADIDSALKKFCQNKSDVLVCNSCPEGWKLWRSKCYYFSTDWKRWTESRFHCLQQGADLVIIESKEEQEFIRNNTQGTTWGTWIGLRYTERKWLWVDGTAPMERFWEVGHPITHCRCAFIFGSKWHSDSCFHDTYKSWICETNSTVLNLKFLGSEKLKSHHSSETSETALQSHHSSETSETALQSHHSSETSETAL